jgi:hypothetical protein
MALTAEAIAGRWSIFSHPGQNFSDLARKPSSATAQGGQFGLTAHSFSNISLPFIGITPARQLGPLANAAWHKFPSNAASGDKYEVFTKARVTCLSSPRKPNSVRSSKLHWVYQLRFISFLGRVLERRSRSKSFP